MDKEIVIVSAVRTPIGSFLGSLKDISAPKLGSIVIEESLSRIGLKNNLIDEVFMGCVLQAGLGQSPAKQSALGAGLDQRVVATTINKVCASGMKAVMLAAQGILTNDIEIAVAGGMENMSQVPHYLDASRQGLKFGNITAYDGLFIDGLSDAFSNEHMGICGEKCAEKMNISREEQDYFAIKSYSRSASAWSKGLFKKEIVNIKIKDKKGNEIIIAEDEEYKNAKLDKIPNIKPAFKQDGTITAANASTINDGAAAMVLMSSEKAKELKLKPIAKIISFADAAQAPVDFPTTPSLAIKKALEKANLTTKDIDFWEINEAFSVVSLANIKILGLNCEKVNIWGGAVSLGHPLGASGARILVTLMSVLESKKAKLGCAAICNGGGGASAIIIERIS